MSKEQVLCSADIDLVQQFQVALEQNKPEAHALLERMRVDIQQVLSTCNQSELAPIQNSVEANHENIVILEQYPFLRNFIKTLTMQGETTILKILIKEFDPQTFQTSAWYWPPKKEGGKSLFGMSCPVYFLDVEGKVISHHDPDISESQREVSFDSKSGSIKNCGSITHAFASKYGGLPRRLQKQVAYILIQNVDFWPSTQEWHENIKLYLPPSGTTVSDYHENHRKEIGWWELPSGELRYTPKDSW